MSNLWQGAIPIWGYKKFGLNPKSQRKEKPQLSYGLNCYMQIQQEEDLKAKCLESWRHSSVDKFTYLVHALSLSILLRVKSSWSTRLDFQGRKNPFPNLRSKLRSPITNNFLRKAMLREHMRDEKIYSVSCCCSGCTRDEFCHFQNLSTTTIIASFPSMGGSSTTKSTETERQGPSKIFNGWRRPWGFIQDGFDLTQVRHFLK